MSVIIVEDGDEGLGIYGPEAVAEAGDPITIYNRTKYDIKIYDPNSFLEDPLKQGRSISGKIIKALVTCKYQVRAKVPDGFYGYAIFGEIDGTYEFLNRIYGTPRIIIVSS